MEVSTLTALNKELAIAREKFPSNSNLFLALSEEVGEVANAIIEGKDWKAEVLQVACVAIRIFEEGLIQSDIEKDLEEFREIQDILKHDSDLRWAIDSKKILRKHSRETSQE